MKALTIDELQSCALRDFAEPKLTKGGVLLATFTGLNPLASLPRIPGHEIGAKILEAGPQASPAGYAPGRHVFVVPIAHAASAPPAARGA